MLICARVITEQDYTEIFPESDDPLIPRKLAARTLGQKAATLAAWDCKKKYGMRKVLISNRVYYFKSDVERVRLLRQSPDLI
ncbi:hypothetical protein [Chryseobacterium gambrini]|uniref:hypothetical protein n=1 Tax=Chryseobacterium gambrini TaxID=373672 RepID=UPI003D1504B8